MAKNWKCIDSVHLCFVGWIIFYESPTHENCALLQGYCWLKKNEMVKKSLPHVKICSKKHSIIETTGIEVCVGRTRRGPCRENVFEIQRKKDFILLQRDQAEEEFFFEYCTNKQMQHHKNNLYTLTGTNILCFDLFYSVWFLLDNIIFYFVHQVCWV